MGFHLAACGEMLWRDRPIDWRAGRLKEMGFGVGLWNWPAHDIEALIRTGADFTIMNGYLQGRLADAAGADELLASARQTAMVGKRLGVKRLNLHGTGLGEGGKPLQPCSEVTGEMWLKARDTLLRICDLAEELEVTFCLENLNTALDHPGVPFARAADTIALVSSINHPRLQLNLDLYHAQIGEGDLIGLCRRALPWVGEIQVADVPGRYEPGIGEVNWANIALALHEMNYTGAIGLEAYAFDSAEAALEAFRKAFTLSDKGKHHG